MGRNVIEDVLLDRVRVHGPLLTVCPVPGCSTLTMGGTCVEHDLPVTREFPRGRPYIPVPARRQDALRIMGQARPGSPG